MDGAAYLQKHGWQGAGYSLNPSNSRALKKPLLVSRKVDVLGVGLNKNDSVSDQWWLRAFDSSLKALGTGQKSALGQVREHGVKRGGLYGRFVKGEDIPGTLDRSKAASVPLPEIAPQELVIVTETTSTQADTTAAMAGKRKRDDPAQLANAKRVKVDRYKQKAAASTSGLQPGDKGYKKEKYAREKAKREAKRAANGAGTGANSIAVGGSAGFPPRPTKAEEKAALKANQEVKAAKKQAKRDDIARNRELKKQRNLAKFEARQKEKALLAENGGTGKASIEAVKTLDQRETAREDNDPVTKERAAKFGLDVKTYKTLPECSWVDKKFMFTKSKELDDVKRANYEVRAEEKGQHFLTYFMTRWIKNANARLARNATDTAMTPVAAEAAGGLGFVVDLAPSNNLAPCAAPLDATLAALVCTKNADLALPAKEVWAMIDPSIWQGVPVKELSKETRTLRRVWMRTRRRLRGDERRIPLAAGGGGVGMAVKSRAQRKLQRQSEMTLAILKHSRNVKFQGGAGGDVVQSPAAGGVGEGASKAPLAVINVESRSGEYKPGEIKLARRMARKALRHEKQATKRGEGSTKGKGKASKQRGKTGTKKGVKVRQA